MYELHYYPGNANLAPHIVLEELGAAHTLRLVDRTQNAHKSADYLKLNPTGRIPVLVDDALVLFETAAICLHLVDRHPEAGLAPAVGSRERAHFYKWLVYLTNTLQAETLTYFYPERLCDDAAQADVIRHHAEVRINEMLDLLEAEFARHGGSWLLGEHYSAADAYLLMLCRWTRGMHRPARSRPHLAAFLARGMARPAVQRAFAAEGIGEPYY
ncbi:glutathione S-transferase family protein [Jeongeupia sp. USM3]|uniref:glutathione S-transferase family protein n=1 Tax=Jeongeupia sp. USM3 TaxID=1906741 RepID=UPI00089DF179|nr:glutathione S-transferase N-terminal domain-containing protein [Jeongeupia sp. USM3]AOY00778.1 glutathione S-transferase [Jeongeupia sp. USM3]